MDFCFIMVFIFACVLWFGYNSYSISFLLDCSACLCLFICFEVILFLFVWVFFVCLLFVFVMKSAAPISSSRPCSYQKFASENWSPLSGLELGSGKCLTPAHIHKDNEMARNSTSHGDPSGHKRCWGRLYWQRVSSRAATEAP